MRTLVTAAADAGRGWGEDLLARYLERFAELTGSSLIRQSFDIQEQMVHALLMWTIYAVQLTLLPNMQRGERR